VRGKTRLLARSIVRPFLSRPRTGFSGGRIGSPLLPASYFSARSEIIFLFF
jgi:hypothetical protein